MVVALQVEAVAEMEGKVAPEAKGVERETAAARVVATVAAGLVAAVVEDVAAAAKAMVVTVGAAKEQSARRIAKLCCSQREWLYR